MAYGKNYNYENIDEDNIRVEDYLVRRTSKLPERFTIYNYATMKPIAGCWNLSRATAEKKLNRLLHGLSPETEDFASGLGGLGSGSISSSQLFEFLKLQDLPYTGQVKVAPRGRTAAEIRRARIAQKYGTTNIEESGI